VEDFNFCPLRRIRHLLNQQKVRIWRWRGRKNKNCYDRSQYVYENKQNDDKMTMKFADFWAQCKPFLQILQKIAGFEGQFTAIFAFGALPAPAGNHPGLVTTPGAHAPPLLNQEGSR
jgi:hypothetical protein